MTEPAKRRGPFLDHTQAVARIELCARRALDDAREADAALAWYCGALRFCAALGRVFDFPAETVAGALAALSPKVGWEVQCAWAPVVLEAYRKGDSMPGPGYNLNKAKAYRILDGAAPLDVLGGPKVRAFYAGIVTSGAADEVCIDRHAWTIAAGIDRIGLRGGAHTARLTDKRYREAAEAYVAAASGLRSAFRDDRLTSANVQALCWAWWRFNADRRF